MSAESGSAPYTAGTVRYAGFWVRFLAAIIDSILLGVVGFVIGFVVGLVGDLAGADPEVSEIFAGLLGFVVGIAYYVLMQSSTRQATFGKLALSLKVTDMEGSRISVGTATAREFSKILSGLILLIGYIMAGFTPKKQSLHDIIAKTLVVKQ